jgi:hypothetical protein
MRVRAAALGELQQIIDELEAATMSLLLRYAS